MGSVAMCRVERYLKLLKAAAVLAVFIISLSCGTWDSPNQPSKSEYFAHPKPYPSPKVDTYEYFFNFRLEKFSPKTEPLIQEALGDELKIKDESLWEFPSYNSFAVGFAVSLPAISIIEYGETEEYGKNTEVSESYFYNHLHYLKNLNEGETYHYRILVKDENNNTVASPDRVFTTKTFTPEVKKLRQVDFKHIHDNEGGGERAGLWITAPGEYVLTENISSNGLGINVKAHNVTIDLNGHTLTYDNGVNSADTDGQYNESASHGIRSGLWNFTNTKIYNGIIKQGRKGTAARAPIYLIHMGVTENEIAGITIDYYSDSAPGMYTESGHTHHNLIYDRGKEVRDRSMGIRALAATRRGNISAPTDVSYNSLRRFRHRGIDIIGDTGGAFVHDNELYSDSFATNSFMIAIGSNGTGKNNKVFGMGYNPIGFGWGNNTYVADNLVYMWCYAPTYRDPEYPRYSVVSGMRVTNYDVDTYSFKNMLFEGNLIVLKAIDGCTGASGFWTTNALNDENNVYRHNTVKVETLPDNYRENIVFPWYYNDVVGYVLAPVTIQGNHATSEEIPNALLFEDNRFISNINHILLGDSYGITSGVRFYRNTLEKIVHTCEPTDTACNFGKEGNEKFFAPVRLGFWYWNTLKNRIVDTKLIGITEEEATPTFYGGTGKMEIFYGKLKTFQFLDGGGSPLADKDITLTTEDSGIVQTKRTDAEGKAEFELLSTRYYKIGNSRENGGIAGTPGKDEYSQFTFSAAGYATYTLNINDSEIEHIVLR
jgi:hypothetical protein